MKQIFFWLEWPLPYRLLYSLGLLLFLASLTGLGYAFYLGDSESIFWTTQGKINVVQIPFDFFEKHLFEFPIQADAYLLVEDFLPSAFHLNEWAAVIYFGAIAISLILILTAISDLPLTYYGVGLAFVVLYIANMKLELLGVGHNITDRWLLILVFLGYAPLSYLFFSFWTQASYIVRIAAYSAVTLALVFYIRGETALESPFLTLTSHSMIFPILAVVACCLFIGHEIIRGFTWMVTNGSSPPKQRVQRLLFLSILYLGNLIYGVAHLNFGYDLDIYFLHPIPVFIISLLLGVWGLRERAQQLHKIMAFAPTASFLYLGLGILASSSVAYSLVTANEALVEVYQDIILHTHLGLGVGFLGYVYFNFKPIIEAGKKVYRIIYKPSFMSFTMAWVFGAALVFGLQFGDNFFVYDQSFAAYYTGLADASLASDEKFEAKQYYKIAKAYDPLNYRVHYTLGSLAKEEGNRDEAHFLFEQGARKTSTPHAYAHMAKLNQRQSFSFQALFDLRQGVERHPDSGELFNNMALMFTQTDVADSAYLYFQLAREKAERPEIVESNLFSLWTKYDFFNNLDSIYAQWKPRPYVGTWANELAFLSKIGDITNKPLNQEFLQDSVLQTPQLCYLYNYVLNTALSGDTTAMPILRKSAKTLENELFDLYLYAGMAHITYQQGNYQEAFRLLKEANKEAGRLDPYYPYLLGLRYLEHEQYEQATIHLKKAYQRGNNKALYPLAVAHSELPNKQKAIQYWAELEKAPLPQFESLAKEMAAILANEVNPEELPSQQSLYRYLHYQKSTLEDQAFDALATRLEDQELAVRAIAERAQWHTKRKEWAKAGAYIAKLSSMSLPPELAPYFQQAYLAYAFAQGKIDADFLSKVQEASYPRVHIGLQQLYEGGYYQAEREYASAIESYLEGLRKMPYEERLYIRLAQAYNQTGQEREAYDILLKGYERNPENTAILKAYTLQSLELGFGSYAEFSMQALRQLLTDAEYLAFEGVYNAKKAAMEKYAEDWQ